MVKVTESHCRCIRVVSWLSRWRELLEGKLLQENGEVCSCRSGEGGEYFILPHNTAVILINTSIHCDIILAKQGELKHNWCFCTRIQGSSSDYSTWKYGSKLACNQCFGKTKKPHFVTFSYRGSHIDMWCGSAKGTQSWERKCRNRCV